MKLYASGEDYLEAILVLHKKMDIVRSVDVARHLGASKPSVCHAASVFYSMAYGGRCRSENRGKRCLPY